MKKVKKVLITGCMGQLGLELIKNAPKGIEIIAVDIEEACIKVKESTDKVKYIEMDITKQECTSQVVKLAPDVIINAAAYTNVDKAESERDKAFAVNATGVRNLAQAASQRNARMIHVSTDYVFDGKGNKPYTVDHKCSPLGAYGKTKYSGDMALAAILPDNHVTIRTAWLYSSHGGNFVKTMLRLMAKPDPLTIVNDQIGTPTSAATLARTIWKFLNKPGVSGTFHWTDDGKASWYDFAVAIKKEAIALKLLPKNSAKIVSILSIAFPTLAERPSYSVLDKSKTYETLKIKGVPWQEALHVVMLELK